MSIAVKVKQHRDKWWGFIDPKGKRKARCIGPSQRATEVVGARALAGEGYAAGHPA
jgi:hypothetical protein